MKERLTSTKKIKFYAPPPADCLEITIDFISPVVKPECIGSHIDLGTIDIEDTQKVDAPDNESPLVQDDSSESDMCNLNVLMNNYMDILSI